MTRTAILRANLLAAVLILPPDLSSAQDTLTLDAAIRDALAHNASLRAARAAVAESGARVAEARAGWAPRISVWESWQRGNQPVFAFGTLLAARHFAAANFAIGSLNHPDAVGSFRSAVSVEQILFDGGRLRSAVEGATLRHDIAELQAEEAASALVLVTVQTYGRVLTAEAEGRAAAAALDAVREDTAHATNRRDAGVATDADVLALVAQVADLEQRAIQHRGDAAVARAELNRLTGARVDREFDVVQPSSVEGASLVMAGLDALLAEADGRRPEVRRAVARRKLADAGTKEARSALVPQVLGQALFDMSGTRFGTRASGWLAGAELRWSFSLGGAELARLKAANDTRARTAAEAEDARAAVHVEVVSAVRRLEAANARYAVGRSAVDQARETQRITRHRFVAGLAGVTDVLRASSAVLDAESHRISAAVDAFVSEAMLRRALGRNQ